MDIEKEREAFEAWAYSKKWNINRYVNMGIDCYADDFVNGAWHGWLVSKQQAVPDGFVVVESEMSWQKADELSLLEWDKVKGLFLSQNRDLTAIQVEEFRLRWIKNKAHDLMRDYKTMIQEAQK